MDPEQRLREEKQLLEAMSRESRSDEQDSLPPPSDTKAADEPKCRLEDLQKMTEMLSQRTRSSAPHHPAIDCEFQSNDRFQLLRPIGQGGFGIVFLAFDHQLQRQVAVKLPRPDLLMTQSLVHRFLREGQNAAKLDHPNLIPVLSTDENFAMPAIVFPYCEGPTLTQFAATIRGPMATKLAATILLRLAEATQHAHGRGVIHRDLKPANILMEPVEESRAEHSVPLDHHYWIPRITDFGVSKWVNDLGTESTHRAMMGTLCYMSPEQLLGKTSEVGTSTDIYSLGVVLYELLAQRTPYRGETYGALSMAMMQGRPPSIRSIRPEVPADLEAIAMRCLEFEPANRYASARELAEDLRNYLNGKPVVARPLTRWNKLRYQIRQQPFVAGLIMMCIVMAMAGMIGLLGYLQRSHSLLQKITSTNEQLILANSKVESSRQLLLQKSQELQRQVYASDLASSYRAYQRGDLTTYEVLLRRDIPASSEEDIRGWDWRYLWSLGHRSCRLLRQDSSAIYSLKRTADSSLQVVGGASGVIALHEMQTGKALREWATSQQEVNCATFSPDGKTIASAGDDGSVALWTVATGQLQSRFVAHPEHAWQVYFVDDSTLVTSGNDPVIRLWNLQGECLAELKGHQRGVQSLVCCPRNHCLISVSDDETIQVWSLPSGEVLHSLKPGKRRLLDVAIDPMEKHLVVSDEAGSLFVYQFETSQLHRMPSHSELDGLEAITFSSDGKWFAAASRQGTICLFRLSTNLEASEQGLKLVASWMSSQGRVFDIAFDETNQFLDSVGSDGTWRRWSIEASTERKLMLLPYEHPPTPDYSMMYGWLDRDQAIFSRVGDLLHLQIGVKEPRTLVQGLSPIIRLLVSHDGKEIFTGHVDGRVAAWDWQENQLVHRWAYALQETEPGVSAVTALAFQPESQRLAVAYELPINQIQLIDTKTGRRLEQLDYPSGFCEDDYGAMAFSLDGQFLAHGLGNRIAIWKWKEKKLDFLSGHTNQVRSFVFHPTEPRLFSASDDRSVRDWDLTMLREQRCMRGHQGAILSLAILPDGRQLVSASQDGNSKVWQISTGERAF